MTELAEQEVLSVGEFLAVINEVLGARDFVVTGEIVEAKDHPTGFYFTIKDTVQEAVLECYASPYVYRGLGLPLERGMVVKVGGVANVWKKRGRFSFRAETIELAGEGSLKKAYEALKKKLIQEGLAERKRPLPEFIRRIGLMTSRTGVVIQDFRRNLIRTGMKVSHYDVRVEGAQAAAQITRGFEWFNARASDYDVLVLIRGGGSLEDLKAFNDEFVARAVFGSRIPTIVAIGHAPDTPLAQMVADAIADTPTGAAHVVNDSWSRLSNVGLTAQRLAYAYDTALASVRADADASLHRLATHLGRVGHSIATMRQSVDAAERQLTAASPEHLLRQGYSIVLDDSGAVVRAVSQLRHGQSVHTRLGKGSFTAEVKELQST